MKAGFEARARARREKEKEREEKEKEEKREEEEREADLKGWAQKTRQEHEVVCHDQRIPATYANSFRPS